MKKKSEVVSFRADEDELRELDQARRDFELSRGAWVKFAAFSHLRQRDQVAVTALLSDLVQSNERHDGELAKLQTNQARILYAILTVIGGMKPDEAKDIVRNKLLA